jgi:SRSO17 transposase
VLADADDGGRGEFRAGLEQRGFSEVVGIPRPGVVWAQPPRPRGPRRRGPGPAPQRLRAENETPPPVKGWAQQHQLRFRPVRWREGAHGAMRSRFLVQRVQTAHRGQFGEPPGQALWLLVAWPVKEPEPSKYFGGALPGRLSRRRLGRVAKSRHGSEPDCQPGKEERGRDHFAGRSWHGWRQHVTWALRAQAFWQRERRRRRDKSSRDAAAPPA